MTAKSSSFPGLFHQKLREEPWGRGCRKIVQWIFVFLFVMLQLHEQGSDILAPSRLPSLLSTITLLYLNVGGRGGVNWRWCVVLADDEASTRKCTVRMKYCCRLSGQMFLFFPKLKQTICYISGQIVHQRQTSGLIVFFSGRIAGSRDGILHFIISEPVTAFYSSQCYRLVFLYITFHRSSIIAVIAKF